ncbi:MAG: hypothetical protein ACFB2Y_03305 [Fulvivirga sp.]
MLKGLIRQNTHIVENTLAVILVFVSGFCYSQTELYVSDSQGNDANDGSITSPFKTIQRAKDEARLYASPETVDIYIREGIYYLNAPLEFNSEDDNTNYRAYGSENVVVSGGVKIPYGS